MRHLDLFSGIGGFALAARWCGWETVQFVEFDKYCQKVLNKNFPGVPIHGDIKTYSVDNLVNALYNQSPKLNEVIDMANKRKDYDSAVTMYNSGLSISDVADFYGISRQAMWAVLKRRGCIFRDKEKMGPDNHFYRGTKASDKAQNILEKAIQKGIIKRLARCQKCGEAKTFKDGRSGIQAHHYDYNQPLKVQWLCQKCHHEWHKNNKAIPRKEVVPDELSEETAIDIVSGGFP